ncbi:GNAT family N-acetyltransferase [Marinospirillum perlucidum]|uniref:GNAT family N-acetyltransferase n=1 Tax=Marinospirillum perlucidum TaxID=1982602 RepID=UPI000DF350C5|nr:GNAT family N-acetyltransferase [Marinospirillum perlucidum]
MQLIEADLNLSHHVRALVALMDEYACHPMGQGKPLSDEVKACLPEALKARSDNFHVLAFDGERPVGLVNCFEGFSTFACKPLVNIHDVIITADYRGQGLTRLLFDKVEEIARQRGCCKITLEVLEGNQVAQQAYRAQGFSGYELDPQMGQALFWEKKL